MDSELSARIIVCVLIAVKKIFTKTEPCCATDGIRICATLALGEPAISPSGGPETRSELVI